jgi:hypothetical protein
VGKEKGIEVGYGRGGIEGGLEGGIEQVGNRTTNWEGWNNG